MLLSASATGLAVPRGAARPAPTTPHAPLVLALAAAADPAREAAGRKEEAARKAAARTWLERKARQRSESIQTTLMARGSGSFSEEQLRGGLARLLSGSMGGSMGGSFDDAAALASADAAAPERELPRARAWREAREAATRKAAARAWVQPWLDRQARKRSVEVQAALVSRSSGSFSEEQMQAGLARLLGGSMSGSVSGSMGASFDEGGLASATTLAALQELLPQGSAEGAAAPAAERRRA
eukprot:scaffold7.g3544.t1